MYDFSFWLRNLKLVFFLGKIKIKVSLRLKELNYFKGKGYSVFYWLLVVKKFIGEKL